MITAFFLPKAFFFSSLTFLLDVASDFQIPEPNVPKNVHDEKGEQKPLPSSPPPLEQKQQILPSFDTFFQNPMIQPKQL